MFNLKKTEQHLLNCLNSAELAVNNKDNNTYFKIRIPPGYNFPSNKDIEKHIMQANDEIMRDEPIKTNLPEKYIKEEIENILFRVFYQPEAQRPEVLNKELFRFRETIKEKIRDEIEEYTFTLHIDKLLLEKDVTIGEVSFYKLDEDKAKEIKVNQIEKQYRFIQSVMGGNANFSEEGGTYAEVRACGIQGYAYSLALYKIRLALNIIKLYIDPDYCNFGLDGETHIAMHRKSFLSYNDSEPLIRVELVGNIREYFLNKKSLEFMEENGLNELSKILQKEPKPSEYDNRLLTGIYWFGEALSVITHDNKDVGNGKRNNIIENLEFFYMSEKLLKLFTSLESVLIFSKSEQITENIAERAALIIGVGYDNRVEIKRRVKNIYNDRSKAVHQGVTYVSKRDLLWLIQCVREVLYRLIELETEYKFNSKEELREYIEKLKFS